MQLTESVLTVTLGVAWFITKCVGMMGAEIRYYRRRRQELLAEERSPPRT